MSTDSEKTNGAPAPVKKYRSRLANPGPVGLFSFASTTFILSMYNVNTRGVHAPNVVVGMAIFTGGLLQFMAGMWEFPRGNTFGATALSSYGAFWMSYATILIPSSGIIAAYASDPQEFDNAIGVYLMTWFMVTVMLIIPVLRRNIAFVVLLTSLALAFLLLACASFSGKTSLTKAGGAMGIIAALIAYYVGVSEMLDDEAKPIVVLPRGVLYTNE